jgi:single-strand DNA-binding protein
VSIRNKNETGQNNFFQTLIFTNMNALRNKVSLIGRLGANPEVVTFESGKKLARFNLAINESYKLNGEWQKQTQWHTISAWGKTAERIQSVLQKGHEIMLEGRLVNKPYETKAGEKRISTSIELTEFVVLKSVGANSEENLNDLTKTN